jgi:hypothetical protein
MLIFILGAIIPDIVWVAFASEYWGIFPPAPPEVVPILQFFHGLFGQLMIWMWVGLVVAYTRLGTYENVLAAGVAGAVMHHIVDLVSHEGGQFPLYPYVQQDWSVGWFLDSTGGLFNEISWFGFLLFILFAVMFGLIAISYTRIDIIERVSILNVLFLNVFITIALLSYWIGYPVSAAAMLLTLVVWAFRRVL